MAKLVNLVIDEIEVQVPDGTLIVNAAMKVGVHIPVFCYHPKMEPVGMCRMCLVEVGRPVMNRETGQLELEADGSLKIQFGAKLETACTTPVSEGMVVRGLSDKVRRGRKDILEFLLTSHPLDCPICDKGGECPLQNLTIDFGPGTSRFIYDEKKHLAKHKPLGELIYLDQERCIQCGRCVRFQTEIVDDAVIGFSQRGRSLQIVTNSDPGFDSYFSGNTTDICPVGALTTSDFRFQARPWELKAAASICPHCPVGCNLALNVRREQKAGGAIVVKRVMPRQNEFVNEIWICDKGRFAYHFAENKDRLTQPLRRKNGELSPISWDEAFDLVADKLRNAKDGLLTLASGRLANEDLFNLNQLTRKLGGQAVLDTQMAGGDLVAQVGVGQGTNFSDMGAGTVIFVLASDLEEEAPIYWLRVKQAAERGATLIVANPRPTKLERYASQVLRYPYGAEAALVLGMVNTLSTKRPELPEAIRDLTRSADIEVAARTFSEAENAVIFFGSEGVGLATSSAMAQACANLLIVTNHIGRASNGLIGVWPQANTQGAWDMGFRPMYDLEAGLRTSQVVYIAGSDPAGNDPQLVEALKSTSFLIVQELFLTETAQLADVVLPAQSFIEREGTLTNGERRVQRFYPVVPVRSQALPDFTITARLAECLGLELEGRLPVRVMEQIAAQVSDYTGISYKNLSEVVEQWPIVARSELYYGGTSYENRQGLGVQIQPGAQRGESVALGWIKPSEVVKANNNDLLSVPVTRLYDRGRTIIATELLHHRIPQPYVALHPKTADKLRIIDGAPVSLEVQERLYSVLAHLDENVPESVILVPRSMGIPVNGPVLVKLLAVERVAA